MMPQSGVPDFFRNSGRDDGCVEKTDCGESIRTDPGETWS